ncbi:MAG TPA: D-glycero-beta-D-manno-heptose 1-phosphate adenylyltransferase [Verrucomicrobiae bacterium]|jgi:D-beta-D-heptose 7-phosphate kinase/D-beta-D-heptose 1-phosphate adenosyltransferase|nr:D-glycero-beta-D-manno-heptose 1-phosphate adenylyltransferase [Verrucomicrobiae bacterium]
MKAGPKILTETSLARTVAKYRAKRKKIVFTNGTFDILHAGHVRYLAKARTLGDVLIIGVNNDASVRAYKGPTRPVNPQEDRLEVLSALACVDNVILFGEPTPINLILKIRPDVLVKGADWKTGDIVGGPEVKSWGGKVKRITFLKGRSTTNVITKILEKSGQ